MSPRARRLQHLGVALGAVVCLIGVAIALIALPVAPRRQLEVKVRWADGVTDAEKTAAARELGLAFVRVRDDGVWVVEPRDPSPESVRRFVTDSRIADTDGVDRRVYALRYESQTFREWFIRRYPSTPQVIERLTPPPPNVTTVFAAALLGLVLAGAYPAATKSTPWIFRGIPAMSDEALALFRVAYGITMLLAVRTLFTEITEISQRAPDWWARTAVIQGIRSDPQNVVRLLELIVTCLALFAIGLVPRLALAVATIGLICVDGVLLGRRSIHDLGLPTMTMTLMLLVPWHRGFGVSQALRRWRGKPESAPSLPPGLALWIPAFAMGIAFLAAAYAKLHISGVAWITSGAVRYHFIDDSTGAPVTWGMRIATSDVLSIAMSLGAIAVEATVWLVIWFNDWRARLAFGLVAASLLVGFFLFQGVFWPAWWTILLAFLPWEQAVVAFRNRLPRFTVLIDGECPVCRRTARLLYGIDWFDRLTFADAANDAERTRLAPELDRNLALTAMHVIGDDGERTAGYDGCLALARSLPLLWIPRALGALPPVHEAGRRIYRRFASARTRDGRCTDAVCDPHAAPLPRPSGTAAIVTAISPALSIVFALVLTQQIVVSALAVESQPFISNFPMYSHTYLTRQAFDAHLRRTSMYVVSAGALGAGETERRLAEFGDLDEVLYPAIDAAAGQDISPDVRDALRTMLRRYEDKYGMPLEALSVVRRERRFDWERGEFENPPRVTFEGTIDLVKVAAGE